MSQPMIPGQLRCIGNDEGRLLEKFSSTMFENRFMVLAVCPRVGRSLIWWQQNPSPNVPALRWYDTGKLLKCTVVVFEVEDAGM